MCASVRESPASGKSSAVELRAARRIDVHITAAEIWLAALTQDAASLAACQTLLSAEETARAAQFKASSARTRFVVARAHLRMLLGSKLGLPPRSLEIVAGPHGKPALECHPEIRFNVSHADDVAVIALSEKYEAGIDIESLARTVDHAALAQKYLSKTEQDEFARIPAADRKEHFLKLWTCKEAVAKALGDGLQLPFAQIEVSIGPETKPQLRGLPVGSVNDWTLHGVDAGRGYVATLALHSRKI